MAMRPAPSVQKLEIVPKKPSGRFSLPLRLSRFSLGNNKSASDSSSDGLAGRDQLDH